VGGPVFDGGRGAVDATVVEAGGRVVVVTMVVVDAVVVVASVVVTAIVIGARRRPEVADAMVVEGPGLCCRLTSVSARVPAGDPPLTSAPAQSAARPRSAMHPNQARRARRRSRDRSTASSSTLLRST